MLKTTLPEGLKLQHASYGIKTESWEGKAGERKDKKDDVEERGKMGKR